MEGKGREQTITIFEEIRAKNFFRRMNNIKLQIQEVL